MVAGSRVFSWFLGLFSIGLHSYWAVLLFYKRDVIYGLITNDLKTEPVGSTGSTGNRTLIRSDYWLKPKIKCSKA